jgi:hypothetical protein
MAQREAKHNRARAHEEIVDRVRYVEHIAAVHKYRSPLLHGVKLPRKLKSKSQLLMREVLCCCFTPEKFIHQAEL